MTDRSRSGSSRSCRRSATCPTPTWSRSRAQGMGALIAPVRERRPLTRREFEVYRATTEAQAVQGVLLDDMLQAWHVGFDALRTWGREKTSNGGAGAANILLDFLDIVIPWYDGGMATSVDWYRAAANRAFLASAAERAAFVRRVVGGGLEPAELPTREPPLRALADRVLPRAPGARADRHGGRRDHRLARAQRGDPPADGHGRRRRRRRLGLRRAPAGASRSACRSASPTPARCSTSPPPSGSRRARWTRPRRSA